MPDLTLAARHWQCSSCRKPVTPGDGLILVFNANEKLGPVGGYPVHATPSEAPPEVQATWPSDPWSSLRQVEAATWLLMREQNVDMGVFTAAATHSVRR